LPPGATLAYGAYFIMSEGTPRVGILMGSASDWPTMQHCALTLKELGVECEYRVLSAHRTPAESKKYAETARERGLKVVICAAGGAAHLAGVIASLTSLPVLGVPMKGWAVEGMDALLATVMMPAGIPVGTLAVGKAGAKNAAILATQILALSDEKIAANLEAFRTAQTAKVLASELPEPGSV
jgi:5-(carboxyamino)imidazole ribonucleotide mutase